MKRNNINLVRTVGLTGGIGAGKSVVSYIFELLGVPVYISDIAAKRLMVENDEVKDQIKEVFGNKSYSAEGVLNRGHLSRQIFQNEEKLKQINSIVHPAVRNDFVHWCMEQKDETYIIQESALIFEIGLDKFYDKVILVTAPDEVRIKRVMSRDNVDRQQVLDRMANQMNQDEKIKKADLIIENDGTQSIIQQAVEMHNHLMTIFDDSVSLSTT